KDFFQNPPQDSGLEPTIPLNEEIQNTLGFHLKAGLNILMAPAVFVKLEVKYVIMKPVHRIEFISVDNGDMLTPLEEDVNLNTLFINAGLTISLK
ncbi:MAG: hypothetical protein ACE5GL_03465, partial [Calditrichia bacterium]